MSAHVLLNLLNEVGKRETFDVTNIYKLRHLNM